MADFTITHRIEAPELTAALNNLAEAIRGGATAPRPVQPVVTPAVQEKPVQAVSEAPVNPPAAPATNTVNGATTATTPAPTVAAPTPVQTEAKAPATPATSKAYTLEDIVNAGSQLLEQGKMPQLMELLNKSFGVQAVTQLKAEQYADVAAALVKLGAKI